MSDGDSAPRGPTPLEALAKVLDILSTQRRTEVETIVDYLRSWNKKRPAPEDWPHDHD
jgi:erythromycin esterase-like protein